MLQHFVSPLLNDWDDHVVATVLKLLSLLKLLWCVLKRFASRLWEGSQDLPRQALQCYSLSLY